MSIIILKKYLKKKENFPETRGFIFQLERFLMVCPAQCLMIDLYQNIALRNIRPLNTKERWSKYIESEKKKGQFLHEGAEIRMALNFLNATLES